MTYEEGMTAEEAAKLVSWTGQAMIVLLMGTREQAVEVVTTAYDADPEMVVHAAIQWTVGVIVETTGALGRAIAFNVSIPDGSRDTHDLAVTLIYAVNHEDWTGARLLLEQASREQLIQIVTTVGRSLAPYLKKG